VVSKTATTKETASPSSAGGFNDKGNSNGGDVGRYIIFHNPISGAGRASYFVKGLTEELRRHGHAVDDCCPADREEAIRTARTVDATYDGVIGVGGDGTLNTLVNGLAERGVPLMAVPAGTENVLCRALGIPSDPTAIRGILEAGYTRTIDVGMANDRAFVAMSGVGFDATVTGEVHRRRSGPIKRWYYYWPMLKLLYTYDWPRLTVEVDGEQLASGAGFVIVGNVRLYADRLHICDRATPDDGLLDVCVFKNCDSLRLFSYFLSVRLGRHLRRSDVAYRQGRRITVRAERAGVPFQVDGDAAGTAPVEYTVRMAAMRMFVPRLVAGAR
jgi:YegS/Rv2252/BmrU family lipid kinase